MFKSVIAYRIDPSWEGIDAQKLQSALELRPFHPVGLSERRTVGWVAPRDEPHSPLVEVVAGQYLFKVKSQTRVVPSSAVKEELEARLERIEQETGRRPKGQAKRDLKEQIEHELLPRAFTKTGATLVWLDPKARMLYVNAGSLKKADAVTSELVQTLEGALPLKLLQTTTSPATAMATWLREQFTPTDFSIDEECVLRQPDESKATVRYSRHNLESDEVVRHIEQGKLPTQLAMTWNRRVSFVLTDSLQVRKLKFLDVVLEDAQSGAPDTKDSSFDADAAITTTELSRLIPALIAALDGELEVEEAAA